MLLANQCCWLLFTEVRANRPTTIEGVNIPIGKTFWVADEMIDSLRPEGGCQRLVGLLVRHPTDQRMRIRICNCPDVCYLEGKMTRDPVSQRMKFKAEIPQDCCQCEVQLRTLPYCQPVLDVPKDCYDVTSYDTCDPPTYSDQLHSGTGVCYPRGTLFETTFPVVITHDARLYYFKEVTTYLCSQTATTRRSRYVSLTLPTEDECPGRCQVIIEALYELPCCQCEIRLVSTPSANEDITISHKDCDNQGLIVHYGDVLCYPAEDIVGIDLPLTINVGGETWRFKHVEWSVCYDPTPVTYWWASWTIHLPDLTQCPTDCWVQLHAYYVLQCVDKGCLALMEFMNSPKWIFAGQCTVEPLDCFRLPITGCGDHRCMGCHAWAMEKAENYFHGLVVPLEIRDCDLRYISGHLEESVCHASGECIITNFIEYEVLLRINSFHWNCESGETTICGKLAIFAKAGWGQTMACFEAGYCRDCEGTHVGSTAYMGTHANDPVLIGFYDTWGEAAQATINWLETKQWMFVPDAIGGNLILE